MSSTYIRAPSRASGAAALVAGVAAQLLEQRPRAAPAELRVALLQAATQHVVTGAGAGSPTALLFTNLTRSGAAGAA